MQTKFGRLAKSFVFLLLIVTAGAGFVLVVVLESGQPKDFVIFYTAGKIVKNGLGRRLYDIPLQESIIRNTVRIDKLDPVRNPKNLLYYNHPPFEAVFFVPFAFLSYRQAFITWEILELVFLGVSLYLLRAYFARISLEGRLALTGAMFFPVAATLNFGQDVTVVVLSSVLAFTLLKRRRLFLAGCCLGAGVVKFQLLAPLFLILLLRRQWKILAGSAVVGALEGLISFLVVGRSVASTYLAMVSYTASQLDAWLMLAMPNMRGFLFTILAGRLSRGSIEVLAVVASLGLILLIALWPVGTVEMAFTTAVAVSPLAAYHSLGSDLLVMLLPAVVIVSGTHGRGATWLLFLLFLAECVGNLADRRWVVAFLPSLLLALLTARGSAEDEADRGVS